MVQVIQHKRRIGAGPTGGPGTLAAGELAYNSNGKALFVGDDTTGTVIQLVGVERQLEIHANSPAQVVAGLPKTFSAAAVGPTLKITGGNPGEFLSTTNVDGTLAFAPMISASQQFVGSAKGNDGTVTLTAVAGGGTVLPAAAPANNGWYVIYDVAGTVKPPNSGALVVGPFEIGDWLISNGSAWTHLAYGGISSVTAADVGVAPTILGGDDVQEVLTTMAGLYVTGPATSTLDGIAVYADATGQTIKDSPTKLSDLATTVYVDQENTDQDAIIATKGDVSSTLPVAAQSVAVFLDVGGKMIVDGGVLVTDLVTQPDLVGFGDVVGPATVALTDNIAIYSGTTGKLIADGGQTIAQVLAAAGDVKGQTTAIAAIDNIAVYSGVDPKAIKDGGVAISALALKTDITTAQADDVKIAGSTMTGPLLLSMHPISGTSPPLQAATIQAIDDAIASIPGASPPLVVGPELIGDGTLGNELEFTGITHAASVPADVATASGFKGTGLSTDPLILVVVDGGTF